MKIKRKKIHKSLKPLQNIYKDADETIANMLGRVDSTCKMGCNHCCHQLILITVLDGIYLAGYIMSRPDWKMWIKKVIDSTEEVNKHEFTPDKMTQTLDDYYAKRIPCIFLDDGCVAYRYRPLTCRSFFSLTDPDKCITGEPVPRLDTTSMFKDFLKINKKMFKNQYTYPFPTGILLGLKKYSVLAKDRRMFQILEERTVDGKTYLIGK